MLIITVRLKIVLFT